MNLHITPAGGALILQAKQLVWIKSLTVEDKDIAHHLIYRTSSGYTQLSHAATVRAYHNDSMFKTKVLEEEFGYLASFCMSLNA